LLASTIFDLPSGPMIVWALVVVGLIFNACRINVTTLLR